MSDSIESLSSKAPSMISSLLSFGPSKSNDSNSLMSFSVSGSQLPLLLTELELDMELTLEQLLLPAPFSDDDSAIRVGDDASMLSTDIASDFSVGGVKLLKISIDAIPMRNEVKLVAGRLLCVHTKSQNHSVIHSSPLHSLFDFRCLRLFLLSMDFLLLFFHSLSTNLR